MAAARYALPRILAAIGVALVAAAGRAHSDDAPAVRLLTDDSFVGWDHASVAPRGWKVEDGALVGSSEATPLLCGWTFGEFELRFDLALDEQGSLRLTLPVVPPLKDRIPDPHIAPKYELIVAAADNCQLYQDQRLIAAGTRPLKAGRGHHVVLGRADGKLSLTIDRGLQFAAELPDARLGLELSIPQGKARLGGLSLVEPPGEPLFNGKDLAGWETDDPPGAWLVENGELVCTGQGRDYLRAAGPYSNFTLSLEYKLSRRGNSGIGIRTPTGGWPSGDGIELQLYDEPADAPLTRHSTMALYGNLEPLSRADRPDQWNRAVVKADGCLVTAWINGVLVQHANTFRLPELKHRHAAGWIGLQNHHSPIRFRNVRLLAAPEGRGLPAWQEPRPETASQVVLDRLMNGERLSRADGIRSGSIARVIDLPGEHVLAELAGPGAIVEIAAVGRSTGIEQGTVAIFLDGDDRPRIRCPLRELPRHVVPLSEDGLPVLTFLAYRQRAKVVLEGPGGGEYRVDFLSLPGDLAVETFGDRDTSVARGLLPAISYRLDQMDGGRHRELDPYPKYASGLKTIEPHATVELLRVTGSGIVDWWKLHAPPGALDGDNLLVAITVDGEPKPAIEAPARLLFGGLAAGANWHNYVLLNSDGATNRLAMPFSNALKIAVTNAGESPIAGIGFTVSVLPADQPGPAIDARMRLRGQYREDRAADRNIVQLAGGGRLVGLICQPPQGHEVRFQFRIDGRPEAELTQTAECFFGFAAGAEVRNPLCGTTGNVAWRYLLLAPIDYERSLELTATGQSSPTRWLALYYQRR
jgi:hypothetical protein